MWGDQLLVELVDVFFFFSRRRCRKFEKIIKKYAVVGE